ncbi:hypothetical protein [Streptomyces sp. NPDC056401]|uniref:hypothetical protein n=1 Tax=Streptomyces sp. NPDC056401 TaxID=3345809 RepID=UPI0035D95916
MDDPLLILLLALLVLMSMAMVLFLYMVHRNNEVWFYRRELLHKIRRACNADILKNRESEWRFKAFESVDYDRMVDRFWKPLDSFYDDLSFTDPNAVDPQARTKHLEAQSDMWPEKKL